jgi:glucose/arabinose dehydrogenase
MRKSLSQPWSLLVGAALLASSADAVSAAQRGAPSTDRASSSPSPATSGASQVLQARGDERLVWEHWAASSAEIARIRFGAYVDGGWQPLPAVTCASDAGPRWFECTSPLPALSPGVHEIKVAAYLARDSRAEGTRSAAILVRYGAATGGDLVPAGLRQTDIAPSTDAPSSTEDQPSIKEPAPSMDRTWTTPDGVRLQSTAIASGLDDATDLLPLPDGRVLVAERAGRVRVFRDGVLLDRAAVTLDDLVLGDGRGLLALAADRAFPSTPHIFAIYTTADGLRVARFTAVGDTLVDRAVLLDGLPVATVQPAALLRTGPDGRLYVALDDGGDRQRLLDMGSYSGKVLRFSTDGTVPTDQPMRSPVWSVGVSRPVGLVWSVQQPALRLVSVEPEVAVPQTFSPASSDSAGNVARFSLAPEIGASRVAIGAGPSMPAFRDDLLVASAGERAILRVRFPAGDVPGGGEWLLRDLPGPVTALAVAADGAIFAAVGPTLLQIIAQ